MQSNVLKHLFLFLPFPRSLSTPFTQRMPHQEKPLELIRTNSLLSRWGSWGHDRHLIHLSGDSQHSGLEVSIYALILSLPHSPLHLIISLSLILSSLSVSIPSSFLCYLSYFILLFHPLVHCPSIHLPSCLLCPYFKKVLLKFAGSHFPKILNYFVPPFIMVHH